MAVNINNLMATSEAAAARMLDFQVSAARVVEEDAKKDPNALAIQQLTLDGALTETVKSIQGLTSTVQRLKENGITLAGDKK